MSIFQNYRQVQEDVKTACFRAGRAPEDITIIGVTKTYPAEVVVEAAEAGILDVGENRPQELAEKARSLPDLDVRWHMIGHLQTNKVRIVLPLISLIHSLDRISLAKEIEKRATALVPVLIQVKTTDEPSKFGVAPGDVHALVDEVRSLPNLKIRGFMTIGPRGGTDAENRAAFATLRETRDKSKQAHPDLDWKILSMGMSTDFQSAIEEGATHIRVGRQIFGSRPPLPNANANANTNADGTP